MKKIVIVLAMFVLVLGSAFAVDIFVGVEIGTGITFNTADMDKSEYFTGPNYDDVGIGIGIETEMFGAFTAFGAGEKQDEFSMYDTNAWVKLGSFSKIQIGDFSNSTANAGYLLGVVDEYDLGILRYGTEFLPYHEPDTKGFNGDYTITGDKLSNLVVDFYAGPATIQLAWMTPFLPAEEGATLNYGGRISTAIGDFVDLTFTATYYDFEGLTEKKVLEIMRDEDGNVLLDSAGDVRIEEKVTRKKVAAVERTTIGTFVGFPELGALVGYTASIRMNDNNEVDHGIDLRIDIPLGDVLIGTHNNLSLYGDKKMVVYNEVGAGLFLTDDMFAKLKVRSHYYNDGANDTSAYDLSIYLNMDYSITEWAMISTGIEVTGIGNVDNTATDIKIGIPFTFKVWY